MIVFFKKTVVWTIIIFLLSSFLRLSNLDLIEFKSDEATTVYQTTQFFDHPYLIQRGLISGTGVYNFPLFNYLIIILGIWSRDPQFLSGAIALINSLLIVAFFLMVKKYYGQLTAIFASLLLAFSPWTVIFSRKIWAQDLIFLFLIPYLYFLHEFILKRNNKVTMPLFLLLMLLIQLHGSGLFLSAVTILILMILRIKINIKNATLGILIGLIPAIPYIIFQINSSPPCLDCEALFKYQQSFRNFDFNNFLRPFQITSGLGYHFVLGKTYTDFIAAYPLINLLKYVFASAIPIILIGITLILFKEQKYLFLIIYVITIPFLYLITKTSAFMHYFVIIIPVSVLLFAISAKSIFSLTQNNFLKTLIITYFLLFLISNITFMTFFYRFLDLKKNIEGDYGPIYSVTKNFVKKETKDYINLPYYSQLTSFAYIYAQSKDFHIKMGEFFLDKGSKELAQKEFRKFELNQNYYE